MDRALPTVASVLYDAVLLPPGGLDSGNAAADDAALRFVRSAYRHGKPIGALGASVDKLADMLPDELRTAAEGDSTVTESGIVTDRLSAGATAQDFTGAFTEAVAAHRHWSRPALPS